MMEKPMSYIRPGIVFLICTLLWGCAGSKKREEERIRRILESSANYHIDKGTELSGQGKYAEALDHFRKAIKLAPYDPVLYNNMGVTFFKMAEMDSAIKSYQTAIRMRPAYARAYTNLGNVYFTLGEYNLALQAVRAAVKKDPEFFEAYILQGDLYEKAGQLDDAIESYKTAVTLAPTSASIHINLGSLYYKNNMLTEAIAEYEKGIEIDPNAPTSYYNLGNAYSRMCMLEEAKHYYHIAMQRDSSMIPARNNNALLILNDGDPSKAAEQFRYAIKTNHDEAYLYFNLAIALRMQDSLMQAIHYVNKAIEIDSTMSRFYLLKGNLLNDQGRVDEAILSFRKALRIDPTLAIVYNNLGNALLNKERISEAIEAFERAVELYPENIEDQYFAQGRSLDVGMTTLLRSCTSPVERKTEYAFIYINLGKAYLKASNDSAAEKAFKGAQKIQPLLIEPYEQLGRIYQKQQKAELANDAFADSRYYQGLGYLARDSLRLAERFFRLALQLKPDYGMAYASLAVTYEKLGEADAAQKSFTQALNLGGDEPKVELMYGEFLARKKDWQNARKYFERVIERDPKSLEAYENLVTTFNALGLASKAKIYEARIHALKGNNLEYTGAWDRALQEYRKAAELDIANAEYLANQGHIYAKKRFFQTADALFDSSLAIDPNNVDALYGKGLVLGDQKNYSAAVEYLQKAVAIDPSFARLHYMLAVNYYFLGRIDEAWEHVQKAQDLGMAVKKEFIKELESARLEF
jgi:tetratricopeptide (TPR) repeat protein